MGQNSVYWQFRASVRGCLVEEMMIKGGNATGYYNPLSEKQTTAAKRGRINFELPHS